MSVPESDTTGLDEKSDEFECAPYEAGATKQAHEDASTNAHVFRGVVNVTQHLQEGTPNTRGKPNVSQTNAFDVDKKPDVSQSENAFDVHHKLDVSDVADAAQDDALLHVDAKSNVYQSVSDVLDDSMQQSQDDTSNVQGELDVGDGMHKSLGDTSNVQGELDVVHSTQHSQELTSNEQGEPDALRPVLDVVGKIQHAPVGSRSNVSRSLLDLVNARRHTLSLTGQSDASKAVLDLVDATQHLQEDPTNVDSINNLISRLKHLLLQERETHAFLRQSSQSRNKLEGLHNLIRYLESQVQQLQKAAGRRGLKYYLANISNKVRGHEVGRIGQSIESELQSWLDQQSVREVANIISKGSEDAQAHAISSFESIVQKGYNSLLQETILSAGLVEKLAALLAPGVASWQVAKAAAFALSTLIDFNKNIFVSLVLMAKTVENILSLMNTEPDEHVLMLVSVIKSMLSVGHTVVVDEIYAHDGVSKIVELLDHKLQDLQHMTMDCVFELAYYGTVEVVDKMFELEVVKKLVLVQQSNAKEGEREGIQHDKSAKQEEANPLDLATSWMLPVTSTRMQDGDSRTSNPFANAVTKFALHLSIGTGLRKREKRALKQEFLRQIREVMKDDTEVANITAEVLWAP